MTLHLALAGEAVRDDIYPVVSLSALARAGMAFVPIRLVENLERDRRQACGQARFDPLLHGHAGIPRCSRRAAWPGAREESYRTEAAVAFRSQVAIPMGTL